MPVPRGADARSRMCWPSFVAICLESAGSLRTSPTAACTWRVCSSPSAITAGFVSMAWERQTWCPDCHQAVPPAQTPSYIVCGLRSRSCATANLRGLTAASWPGAVRLRPTGAWRLYRKPWSTPRAGATESCDRRTTFGRRDFAMLRCSCGSGCRAGEGWPPWIYPTSTGAAVQVCDSGERGPGPTAFRCPPTSERHGCMAAARPWLVCVPERVHPGARAEARPHEPRGLGGRDRGVPSCRLPEVNAHGLRHTAPRRLRAGRTSLRSPGPSSPQPLSTTSIYAQGRPRLAVRGGPAVAGRMA